MIYSPYRVFTLLLSNVWALKTFSQILLSMYFLKILVFIILDRSKCRAHLDINQAYFKVQKDAKQNFCTCEDPIWAVNYN